MYGFDPWGGWVLENYSLYTTVLAAFMRKAGNMSFKVREIRVFNEVFSGVWCCL